MNLQSCTVTTNQANGTVLGEGGGIYSHGGVLKLVSSTPTGNRATTGYADIFKGPSRFALSTQTKPATGDLTMLLTVGYRTRNRPVSHAGCTRRTAGQPSTERRPSEAAAGMAGRPDRPQLR